MKCSLAGQTFFYIWTGISKKKGLAARLHGMFVDVAMVSLQIQIAIAIAIRIITASSTIIAIIIEHRY